MKVNPEADKARAQLAAAALLILAEAADKHVEGIALVKQSAHIEQLAKIASDEQVIRILHTLIEAGVVAPTPPVNGPGGDA